MAQQAQGSLAGRHGGYSDVDLQQWTRVMAGMRKANDELRKGFRSQLRRKLNDVKKDQKSAALALPHVPSEVKKGMAAGLKIEVREKTSRSRAYGRAYGDIRIRMSSSVMTREILGNRAWRYREGSAWGMAKRTNTDGRWRHPVFPFVRDGDSVTRKPHDQWEWVDQGTKSGWFDKPFDAKRQELVKFVNDQLREWVRQWHV